MKINSKTYAVWDIETRPLNDAQLYYLGEDRIQKHPVDRRALDPLTARISMIGMWVQGHDAPIIFSEDQRSPQFSFSASDEWTVIRAFLNFLKILPNPVLIGHNSLGFDVPFLIRRSWKLGFGNEANSFVQYPHIDIMHMWKKANLAGGEDRISLQTLAMYLGATKGKLLEGKDFDSIAERDPDVAKQYLRRDLALTAHCADYLVSDQERFDEIAQEVRETPALEV